MVFILAEITRGGVTDTGVVVTKGLYSKIRHPMYLGRVLMAVGVPLFTRYPEYERYMESPWF